MTSNGMCNAGLTSSAGICIILFSKQLKIISKDKKIQYLHFNDVRGDFLRPTNGTT